MGEVLVELAAKWHAQGSTGFTAAHREELAERISKQLLETEVYWCSLFHLLGFVAESRLGAEDKLRYASTVLAQMTEGEQLVAALVGLARDGRAEEVLRWARFKSQHETAARLWSQPIEDLNAEANP